MKGDEKTCPQCAETVKLAARVCRHCGYEFTAEDNARLEAARAAKQKNTAIGCAALLGLLILIPMCNAAQDGTTPENKADTASSGTDVATPAPINSTPAAASTPDPEPSSAWAMSSEKDDVRGRTISYATVVSENEVDFDFPYSGGSRLRITVRKHPAWGQDVIFHISDGQFVCGIYDCAGTINFGRGPEKLSLNSPQDHDPKTLFAEYGPAIIKKLKASEKVVVELPFYQEGNRQFTFQTKGLEWPPKS